MAGKVSCVICDGDIAIDVAQGIGKCVNCGVTYQLDALGAMAKQGSDSGLADARIKACNEMAVNPAVSPDAAAEAEAPKPEAPQHKDEDTQGADGGTQGSTESLVWKTPRFVSFLGLMFGSTVVVGALALMKYGDVGCFILGCILLLLYLIAAIVYAGFYYPTFFTDKPRIKSSGWIGFWNFFFGGWILGLLWNRNLTRGKKGVSYVVAITGNVLTFATVLLLGAAALGAVCYQEMALDSDSQIGDEVYFGHEGLAPIRWRVIGGMEDGRVLLVSVNNVYSASAPGNMWEFSQLRDQLNNQFIEKHFDAREQAAIVPTPLDNEKSVSSDFRELRETTDRVFLLSRDEVYDYIDLLAGAERDWLTRSTFELVDEDGNKYSAGTYMVKEGRFDGSMGRAYAGEKYGVRPAMVVDTTVL